MRLQGEDLLKVSAVDQVSSKMSEVVIEDKEDFAA
jgi:hypothetical protein